MAVQGIIGRKVGMTQVYAADGRAIPVTVIQAGPCVVVQRKSKAPRQAQRKGKKDKKTGKPRISVVTVTDGYEAVQLGFVEETPAKANKPTKGHFKKANVPATRVQREVGLAKGATETPKVGDQVLASIFANGERVDIVGTGRGKGFQGVVKRHHFAGGAATHGSMFHRAPGSIGSSAFPSRVLKGMRAAGHMGADRVTQKNLTVVRVDGENNILVVKGSIPGGHGGYVVIRKRG